MTSLSVSLRSIPDTGAAVGWAGGHTVVIDRPEGRAGGSGLGFNGAQMLALSLGGCLSNDLRYKAENLGIALDTISVEVSLTLEGEPLLVTSAELDVGVTGSGDLELLVSRAAAASTVSNSVQRGFPVMIRRS